MADEPSNSDETPITFNVKASEAKYALTLPLSTTVLALKEKLSGEDYSKIPAHRQRLIYSGRVLKDAETLASYNVKQGNTVHLVKSAESNPTPSNMQSNAAGTSSTASPVPQMAAGTGRDPMAALTGARYAGFAQMPNANLFGPDGGMGPPPDPEHMASLLENPNFASTLNEALANPDVVEQMLRSNPMFQGAMGAQARQMLQDPNFRRMMTDPTTLRQMSEMRRTMPGIFGGMPGMRGAAGGNEAFPMPGATDATNNAGAGAAEGTAQTGQRENVPADGNPPNPFAMFGQPGTGGMGNQGNPGNPFAALFGPEGMEAIRAGAGVTPGTGATPSAADSTNSANPSVGNGNQLPPSNNPFATMAQQLMQNPQMMQQMMASMGTGMGGASGTQENAGTGAGINPFAALQALQGNAGFGAMGGGQAAPQDTRPPEDRYAEQLRQLNDMGFYEFERNVEALRRTGGSVQGAVEYLLNH